MTRRSPRRTAVVITAAALLATAPFATTSALAGTPDPLPAGTQFSVPPPPDGSEQQISQLLTSGQLKGAALVAREVTTPQASWFTAGTPQQVRQQVRQVTHRAASRRTVPTLVVYDVPGRDVLPGLERPGRARRLLPVPVVVVRPVLRTRGRAQLGREDPARSRRVAVRPRGSLVKRFVVVALEWLCARADLLPWRMTMQRKAIVGCGGYLPLAVWSSVLDERWGTGVWKKVDPNILEDWEDD